LSPATDRWSRRRAAVRAEAEADVDARQQAAIADERAVLEEKTDNEILAELDLPDPDIMEQGDDFAAFMKSAVPERLRKRALRKLWLSNPVLANVDNLVDYGDDFAAEGKLGLVVKTVYQAGKGMLAALDDDTDAAPVAAENTPDPEPEQTPEAVAEPPVAAETSDNIPPSPVVAISEPETDNTPMMARRRMRFGFAASDPQ
jgi:hypothetical protein